jgi:hypothetical protein
LRAYENSSGSRCSRAYSQLAAASSHTLVCGLSVVAERRRERERESGCVSYQRQQGEALEDERGLGTRGGGGVEGGELGEAPHKRVHALHYRFGHDPRLRLCARLSSIHAHRHMSRIGIFATRVSFRFPRGERYFLSFTPILTWFEATTPSICFRVSCSP